jgi:maltooligosyltrehalose trehalohydrolase
MENTDTSRLSDHLPGHLSGGATLIAPGQTRFRLWAPDCPRVSLELGGGEIHEMQEQEGGWFGLELPVGAGTRYRFRISPDMAVPDPMSRAQDSDIHDFSLVVDPAAYLWQTPDWRGRPWPETVIYELHVGLFGGFKGVMAELGALRDIGITAVELMPLSDFPGGRNWGYDGVLPFAPDSAYGTPDELKALVDHAHRLNIMIFLDVVYNHFGPDGNYLGQYASAFFRDDVPTPWGAAINFRHPQVRRYFIENALYWLGEFRMDGLRLDAAQAIPDQDWLPELAMTVRRSFPDRHIHLMLEHDGNAAALLEDGFDAQWNDDLHHALHVLLTNEIGGYYGDYAEAPIEMLARCLRAGFAFQGEVSAYRGGIKRGSPSGHLPADRFISFLQNHDQIGNRAFGERLTTLTSPEKLRVAIALQLLLPQIPLIFMGEEIGSTQPFLFFTSHGPELAEAVRRGRRKEFAGFSAFSDPAMLDRLPDANDPRTYLSCRLETRDSARAQEWSAFYRKLLAVRAARLTPCLTGCRPIGAQVLSSHAVIADWRMGDGQILTIAFNLGEQPVSLPRALEAPLYTLNQAGGGASDDTLPGNSLIACLRFGDH